jgi:hypothetical protein
MMVAFGSGGLGFRDTMHSDTCPEFQSNCKLVALGPAMETETK